MVKYYMGFMFLAWGLSFFTIVFIPHLNVLHLFYFLTVPYGILCLLTFYYVGLRGDIRKYPVILYVTFFVVSYLLYTSLRNFYIMPDLLKGKVADVYYVVGLLPIIFIYTPKTKDTTFPCCMCSCDDVREKSWFFDVRDNIVVLFPAQ